MRTLKKSLSLILALALLVSSVFVGGVFTASAAETELFYAINTYDDEGAEFLYAGKEIYDCSGASYITINGEATYENNGQLRLFSIWNTYVENTAEAGIPDSGNAAAVHLPFSRNTGSVLRRLSRHPVVE